MIKLTEGNLLEAKAEACVNTVNCVGIMGKGIAYLYQPKGAPKADKIRVSTAKPKMTKGRALLINFLELYKSQGYRHTLLEIQKLMYFMQESGENLCLIFVRHQYGPYAENLHHVLQRIDGH
jgi:O-acetyl-ADP-ribose deacetylase (regulator of RNase III)